MSGPQNAIIGEYDDVQLPQMQVDEQALVREEKMARFSKTREYQALKEHLTSRIEYYRSFLPGGTEYATLLNNQDFAEIGQKTVVSDAIINEFTAVLSAYETAADAVKEANRAGRATS